MSDIRIPFKDAVVAFRGFLREQGWSDQILWLTRDRMTGHRTRYWLFRPEECNTQLSTLDFYNAILSTTSSIRMDGFCQWQGATLAYVQEYGGQSMLLNYGILTGERTIHTVSSPMTWIIIRGFNRLRGEAPFLRFTKMTPTNTSRQ
jgi:hypothetical protein